MRSVDQTWTLILIRIVCVHEFKALEERLKQPSIDWRRIVSIRCFNPRLLGTFAAGKPALGPGHSLISIPSRRRCLHDQAGVGPCMPLTPTPFRNVSLSTRPLAQGALSRMHKAQSSPDTRVCALHCSRPAIGRAFLFVPRTTVRSLPISPTIITSAKTPADAKLVPTIVTATL
jgi:hypothetical protein